MGVIGYRGDSRVKGQGRQWRQGRQAGGDERDRGVKEYTYIWE